MKRELFMALSALGTIALTSEARAHVSIASGPGFADQTQVITFGVGHGCEGSDTWKVRVEIPSQVVSVRALNSDLGPAQIELDDAELVRAVTWEKAESSLLDGDSAYYSVALRIKVPDAPFTTLHFPTRQTCQGADGEEIIVDWISTEPSSDHGEEGPEPAPALQILPKRFAGWNKFTLAADVLDLSVFFADAQIVWMGDAAYSANPLTTELIAETEGVSALEALSAGDEIWVKY
jgi:periplasmic copper chaperone A